MGPANSYINTWYRCFIPLNIMKIIGFAKDTRNQLGGYEQYHPWTPASKQICYPFVWVFCMGS